MGVRIRKDLRHVMICSVYHRLLSATYPGDRMKLETCHQAMKIKVSWVHCPRTIPCMSQSIHPSNKWNLSPLEEDSRHAGGIILRLAYGEVCKTMTMRLRVLRMVLQISALRIFTKTCYYRIWADQVGKPRWLILVSTNTFSAPEVSCYDAEFEAQLVLLNTLDHT